MAEPASAWLTVDYLDWVPERTDTAIVAADAMQAERFRTALLAERGELRYFLAEHAKSLTRSTDHRAPGSMTHYRRCIRDTEAELRRIARMLDALDRRFPAERVRG